MILSIEIFADEVDPFEQTNREIFEFNQSVDKELFEPVATSYEENIPQPVQKMVSDFSSNIGDIGTLGNEIVQLEFINGANTLGRVVINSTIGLFGLFDVASEMGFEKTQEDFGQTMAVWGVSEGPYVVLPVLGPSTVRDATGSVVDGVQTAKYTENINTDKKVSVAALQALDTRVKLSPAINLVKRSHDPYIVARSAYLQKRGYEIHNGNPPTEDDEF